MSPAEVGREGTSTRSSERRRPTLRHMPALDGLRGAAVIAVLLFHTEMIRGGYLGVDAFFVLSGFLITSLLVAEVTATGGVDLVGFWGRRFRRLMPALFVFLVGVAGYAVFVADRVELARIRSDALATLAYVANWNAIGREHGYWELFAAPSPLVHTWSLAIEEQFYLLWPLAVALVAAVSARRISDPGSERWSAPGLARAIFFVAATGAVVSATVMWLLHDPDTDTSRVYMGTDTRAAGILLGACLAAWVAWRGNQSDTWTPRRLALEGAATVATVGLAICWVSLDGSDPRLYRGGFFLLGTGAALVIGAAAHPVSGPLAWVFSRRPLVLAGLISYGWYLWHWPVFLVLSESRVGFGGAGLFLLRIGASLALAVVSYHLVETPIRRQQIRLRLPVALPVAAAVVVLAVVASTASGPRASVPVATGDTELPGAQHLDPSAQEEGVRVLIVGDSLANSLAALAPLRADTSAVVGNGSENACQLTEEITAIELERGDEAFPVPLGQACLLVWQDAVARFLPDHLVVVYGNAPAFQRARLQDSWVGVCDADYRRWYEPHLEAALDDFVQAGVTVSVSTLPHTDSLFQPSDSDDRIDCMNQMNLSVARSMGLPVIDLAEHVCPGGICRKDVGGEPLRLDGVHFTGPVNVADGTATGLSGQGAATVLDWMVSEVLANRAQ